MRWPRPPQARKFRVRLVVRRAEGLPPPPSVEPAEQEPARQSVAAEVRWKGPRASGLGSLRRAVRRNRTRGEELASGGGGAVAWEEGFESAVTLAAASHRETAAFQPWELAFTVFTVSIPSPSWNWIPLLALTNTVLVCFLSPFARIMLLV